jgi:hypothetical protein
MKQIIDRIYQLITKNKMVVISAFVVAVSSGLYTFWPKSDSPKIENNTPVIQSVQTIGQVGNNIVVNNTPPQRTILSIKNELISELSTYPQESFRIKLSFGDVESDRLAREISAVLKEVGWNEIGFEYRFDGFYPTGVTIEVKEVSEASQLLADLFAKANLKVSGNIIPELEILTIYIGPNK